MLKIIVLFIGLIPSIAQSQWQIPRYQWEAGAIIAALHHHKCELPDKSWHQECVGGFGIRLNYNWHSHWAAAGGLYFDHMIGQNKMSAPTHFLQLVLKYKTCLGQGFPNLFLNLEGGLDFTLQSKKFNLPVYVGITYLTNQNFDLFFRIKGPQLTEAVNNKSFQIMDNRIEIGIALNPKWNERAKFGQYSGNPFILRSF